MNLQSNTSKRHGALTAGLSFKPRRRRPPSRPRQRPSPSFRARVLSAPMTGSASVLSASGVAAQDTWPRSRTRQERRKRSGGCGLRRVSLSADEVSKPVGAKPYFKHYELLADPNVDVVCIATPTGCMCRKRWMPFALAKTFTAKNRWVTGASSICAVNSARKLKSSSAWCRWVTKETRARLGSRCAT